MYRARNFSKGKIFHVYTGGVRKMPLFIDFQDFQFFLRRLAKYRKETGDQIIVFAIIENHLHLMIRAYNKTSISKLMMRTCLSYAKTYNKKYFQRGHAFQGRFNAIQVKNIPYLLWLSRYIHRNPAKYYKNWETYPWSSYGRYIEEVPRSYVKLDMQYVQKYFKDSQEYREFCRMSDEKAKRWAAEVGRKNAMT